MAPVSRRNYYYFLFNFNAIGLQSRFDLENLGETQVMKNRAPSSYPTLVVKNRARNDGTM